VKSGVVGASRDTACKLMDAMLEEGLILLNRVNANYGLTVMTIHSCVETGF
jgi:hypothetical protein